VLEDQGYHADTARPCGLDLLPVMMISAAPISMAALFIPLQEF
jgi:hypothetical protein